jgi:hypothetical protein
MWFNLAKNAPLIVVSNFHMWEQDAWTNRSMRHKKILIWQQLTIHLGVEDVWHLDSFHKNTKKTFTFDNKCKGAQAALSRINHLYVSMGLDKKGGHMEIATSLKQITYHSLVVLWIHPNILLKHAP